MPQFRRIRLLASLFSLLLLAATTAYAAHHHEDASQARAAEHCDLCLQFGAAAGPSASAINILSLAGPAYQLPGEAGGIRPGRRFLHCLQPRAPPQNRHG